MNEWVCLRCERMGGGVNAICPRCGVALYHAARAEELQVDLIDLTHTADRREPLLRSCPVGIEG